MRAVRACMGCPFRRDSPPGVWEAEHYVRIAYLGCAEDAGTSRMGCHKGNGMWGDVEQSVCAGWLHAAQGAPMARLEQLMRPVRIEGQEGLMTAQEMARANGVRVDLFPPLRWDYAGGVSYPEWAASLKAVRAKLIARPEAAHDYVEPGSLLDVGPTRDGIRQVFGRRLGGRNVE